MSIERDMLSEAIDQALGMDLSSFGDLAAYTSGTDPTSFQGLLSNPTPATQGQQAGPSPIVVQPSAVQQSRPQPTNQWQESGWGWCGQAPQAAGHWTSNHIGAQQFPGNAYGFGTMSAPYYGMYGNYQQSNQYNQQTYQPQPPVQARQPQPWYHAPGCTPPLSSPPTPGANLEFPALDPIANTAVTQPAAAAGANLQVADHAAIRAAAELTAIKPVAAEPVATKPAPAKPAVTEPAVNLQAAPEPATAGVAVAEPAVHQPGVTESALSRPSVVELTALVAVEPHVTEPTAPKQGTGEADADEDTDVEWPSTSSVPKPAPVATKAAVRKEVRESSTSSSSDSDTDIDDSSKADVSSSTSDESGNEIDEPRAPEKATSAATAPTPPTIVNKSADVYTPPSRPFKMLSAGKPWRLLRNMNPIARKEPRSSKENQVSTWTPKPLYANFLKDLSPTKGERIQKELKLKDELLLQAKDNDNYQVEVIKVLKDHIVRIKNAANVTIPEVSFKPIKRTFEVSPTTLFGDPIVLRRAHTDNFPSKPAFTMSSKRPVKINTTTSVAEAKRPCDTSPKKPRKIREILIRACNMCDFIGTGHPKKHFTRAHPGKEYNGDRRTKGCCYRIVTKEYAESKGFDTRNM